MIIIKPKGVKINEQHLRNAAVENKHGYGIATVSGVRTTMDFEEFLAWAKNTDELCVLHMRKKSHGVVDIRNAQPFEISHGFFAHNGTVWNLVDDKWESDSRKLARVVSGLPINNAAYEAIEAILGDDRAVLLYRDGTYDMWGEWEEVDGMYYSSDYYLGNPEFTVAVYGTLKQGYGNHLLLEDAIYLGKGETVEKYPLISGPGFPYAFYEPGVGHHIEVEVYQVDKETLQKLDFLEGVDFGHYFRAEIDIRFIDDGFEQPTYMYFAAYERDPDDELLKKWPKNTP